MPAGHFHTSVAEYLSVQAAKLTATDLPAALLTIRFNPSESFAAENFALTQQQVIRLRDDLNGLLNDPSSWLFVDARELDQM